MINKAFELEALFSGDEEGREGKEIKEKRLNFRVTNLPACLGLTNFSLRDFQCTNPETLKKAKTIWPH